MYASIDLVCDKLEKQISKYKTKIARRLRQNDFKNGMAQMRTPRGGGRAAGGALQAFPDEAHVG